MLQIVENHSLNFDSHLIRAHVGVGEYVLIQPMVHLPTVAWLIGMSV